MKFSEIAEITSGQITQRVQARENDTVALTYKAIVPKSFSDGQIIHSELVEHNLTREIDNSRVTQKGDIVIKLSTPYESVIIDEQNEGLLVTSFCAIIRITSTTYLSEFVCAYLNTEHVRKKLRSTTEGTTINLLRVNNLKNFELNPIDLVTQKKVVNACKVNQEKVLVLKELIENGKKLNESIILSCMEDSKS